MKKLIILFTLFSISLVSTAQMKEIFYDDFSSNKNKWPEGQADGMSAKIEKGKYILESNKIDLKPQIILGIDSSKDYSIEVTAVLAKNTRVSGGGIIFGSNVSEYFTCYVTSTGQFGYAEVKDEKVISHKTKDLTSIIKPGEAAKLKIEKEDSLWFFTVNGLPVDILPSRKLNGLFVGLLTLANMQSEFDDLRIKGTPIATSGNLCQVLPLIYESAKNNLSFIKGLQKNPTNSTSFASAISFAKDYYGTIGYQDAYTDLYAHLKQTSTKEEAIKEIKAIIAELQNCLPTFQFTEKIKPNGDPEYLVNEKQKVSLTNLSVRIIVSDNSIRAGVGLYVNIRKQ